MRNRRNNRYSLGEEDESAHSLSNTKHPAYVMSLGFVATNGTVMALIWFPSGYRLAAKDYYAELAEKLVR